MNLDFKAVQDPTSELVRKIAAITPENPFYTPEYLEVRKRLGAEPWSISLDSAGEPVNGCIVFLTRGRLNSRMEVTSLPVLDDPAAFWNGIFDFCSQQGVSVLSVHTFASIEPTIGETKRRIGHKRRSEYRLDLGQSDLWSVMNRRHHRLIKRGEKAGLTIQRSNSPEARETHVQLANMSLDRRRTRGEAIDYGIERSDVDAFIECGAGELVQAVIGDDVHATMLVARSQAGGYAQSSGTSTAGRGMGASHFLFYEVAKLLRSEGSSVFNLGGADEHSVGLQEFKHGLGATRIELESAEFFTGSKLKRFATGAVSLLKSITFPI